MENCHFETALINNWGLRDVGDVSLCHGRGQGCRRGVALLQGNVTQTCHTSSFPSLHPNTRSNRGHPPQMHRKRQECLNLHKFGAKVWSAPSAARGTCTGTNAAVTCPMALLWRNWLCPALPPPRLSLSSHSGEGKQPMKMEKSEKPSPNSCIRDGPEPELSLPQEGARGGDGNIFWLEYFLV